MGEDAGFRKLGKNCRETYRLPSRTHIPCDPCKRRCMRMNYGLVTLPAAKQARRHSPTWGWRDTRPDPGDHWLFGRYAICLFSRWNPANFYDAHAHLQPATECINPQLFVDYSTALPAAVLLPVTRAEKNDLIIRITSAVQLGVNNTPDQRRTPALWGPRKSSEEARPLFWCAFWSKYSKDGKWNPGWLQSTIILMSRSYNATYWNGGTLVMYRVRQ